MAKRYHKMIALIFVTVFMAACASTPASIPPPTPTALLAAPTNPPPTVTPTAVPPMPTETATAMPPTSTPTDDEEHALELSDMVVSISSGDNTAAFQLYDTTAARELYEQLPLDLELSNFRDAQWMFYPPEELNVTSEEAYHDGKKGDLSYYEPWGDAFMLYKDFYAGDQMHRLGVCIEGIDQIAGMSADVVIEKAEGRTTDQEEEGKMRIVVEADVGSTVFELNDSQAAQDLYEQLPLSVDVEDHGNTEKIFYPPQELDTTNTPPADAKVGTLAYYAPWGDVVMFYGDFGSASGLYELGDAVSGVESIEAMSGIIQVSRVDG